MNVTLEIKGMMCPHCEAAVKKALEGIDGVETAQVSHEAGTAVCSLNAETAAEVLTKAVTDAGYEVTAVR